MYLRYALISDSLKIGDYPSISCDFIFFIGFFSPAVAIPAGVCVCITQWASSLVECIAEWIIKPAGLTVYLLCSTILPSKSI